MTMWVGTEENMRLRGPVDSAYGSGPFGPVTSTAIASAGTPPVVPQIPDDAERGRSPALAGSTAKGGSTPSGSRPPQPRPTPVGSDPTGTVDEPPGSTQQGGAVIGEPQGSTQDPGAVDDPAADPVPQDVAAIPINSSTDRRGCTAAKPGHAPRCSSPATSRPGSTQARRQSWIAVPQCRWAPGSRSRNDEGDGT